MKGKIAMAITIGIICILLTSVMFVQFKSVQAIEESGVGKESEEDLKKDKELLKKEIEENNKLIQEYDTQINNYNSESESIQGTINLLQNDIRKAKIDLGYTDVKGSGIIITIIDEGYSETYASDLLYLVNELKFAGAEAISVNGIRVVNTNYLVDIDTGDSNHVFVDGNKISSPYEIKAIGDVKYLESVINIKGGLKDSFEVNGLNFSYTTADEVYIPKYTNLLDITYGE